MNKPQAEQSKANTSSLSSLATLVEGAVPTSPQEKNADMSLGNTATGNPENKSTPKRGKASRIDAAVLELAKAAWSAEDLGHFDTRDIIGQLLEVIERQDYEMDCLGQLLYDAEPRRAVPTSTPLDARGLITEMRAVAIAAGQFSVDVENHELSLQAFEEAARAGRWADELEKLLAASPASQPTSTPLDALIARYENWLSEQATFTEDHIQVGRILQTRQILDELKSLDAADVQLCDRAQCQHYRSAYTSDCRINRHGCIWQRVAASPASGAPTSEENAELSLGNTGPKSSEGGTPVDATCDCGQDDGCSLCAEVHPDHAGAHMRHCFQGENDDCKYGYAKCPARPAAGGAAPTSTPLDALIAKWRHDAEQHAKHGDCYRRGQGWGLKDCADELEKLLAASPASGAPTALECICGHLKGRHQTTNVGNVTNCSDCGCLSFVARSV